MYTLETKFLVSDLTVNAGITAVDGTAFNSEQVGLIDADLVSITIQATGSNALASGAITFKFASYSSPLAGWDTNPVKILQINLNGISAVRETFVMRLPVGKLKLLSVTNGDATYNASVNASILAIKK